MSACIFLATDFNLPEKERSDGSTLEIELERGMVSDGNADDDYGLYAFTDFDGHTELPYAVSLEWDGFTPERAERLIAYIRSALERCDRVELWHVWLTGFCEYNERPYRKTMTVPICDLTIDDIKTVCDVDVWPSNKAKPTDIGLIITTANRKESGDTKIRNSGSGRGHADLAGGQPRRPCVYPGELLDRAFRDGARYAPTGGTLCSRKRG